jgi:hypothetical protein
MLGSNTVASGTGCPEMDEARDTRKKRRRRRRDGSFFSKPSKKWTFFLLRRPAPSLLLLLLLRQFVHTTLTSLFRRVRKIAKSDY